VHTRAFPYIAVLSIFWGTNIVASRYGIGEFEPFFFITLRLLIAALFFIPILLRRTGRFPTGRRLWGHAAVSGVLGIALPFTLFTLSLQYQSSGVASMYVTAAPAQIAIAAHFFLPDERMTGLKAFGVALALGGSLFLALRGETGLAGIGPAGPLGFILVMAALMGETVNAMLIRRRMKEMDPWEVTWIRLTISAVILLVITAFFGKFSLAGISSAGYLSLVLAGLVGALGGQLLAYYITHRFSATAFSLTSYLVPIAATGFGVLFLHEIVTWGMVVGVILIGGGIYFINRKSGG